MRRLRYIDSFNLYLQVRKEKHGKREVKGTVLPKMIIIFLIRFDIFAIFRCFVL